MTCLICSSHLALVHPSVVVSLHALWEAMSYRSYKSNTLPPKKRLVIWDFSVMSTNQIVESFQFDFIFQSFFCCLNYFILSIFPVTFQPFKSMWAVHNTFSLRQDCVPAEGLYRITGKVLDFTSSIGAVSPVQMKCWIPLPRASIATL